MIAAVAILALAVILFAPRRASASERPRVLILGTGGTIAGSAGSSTQLTEYKAGEVAVADLISAVPAIADIADISGEQICNIPSTSITTEIWRDLAIRCDRALNDEGFSGVVITHGTDTLDETAWFLDLVLTTDKPVVMVGSMRPSTAISSDGPLNLLNAVGVAADPSSRGHGVTIVMNDMINAARDVIKTNTLRVETFQTRDFGALGLVIAQKPLWYREPVRLHTHKTEFSVGPDFSLPRVDIIFAAINDSSDELFRASASQGARGIVLSCPGNGSVPPKLRDAIAEAGESGPVVVRTSRVGSGLVTPSERDKEVRVLTGDTLTAQKARILLQLALTKTADRGEIRRMFERY